MAQYLILRLQGVMQAWGRHSYEDLRPVEVFPTRSGLVGLLGACLGIDRAEPHRLLELSKSFTFAARADARTRTVKGHQVELLPLKFTDFHTIKEPRLVPGSNRKEPVVSLREYLCDAHFTVALESCPGAVFSLDEIQSAAKRPVYAPTLGRRSCPLTHPLIDPTCATVTADNLLAALKLVPPNKGTVYSEFKGDSQTRYTVRDVPTGHPKRQFAIRPLFLHAREDSTETAEKKE